VGSLTSVDLALSSFPSRNYCETFIAVNTSLRYDVFVRQQLLGVNMVRKAWRDQRKDYITAMECAGMKAMPLVVGQAALFGLYMIHDLADELGIAVEDIEPAHVIHAAKRENAKLVAHLKSIEDYQCKPTRTRGSARLDKRKKAYRSLNKPNE
jgi:hypothetical protein